MGLIPDETISEIRERADIVAVIGRHVELVKAGRNHKGLCPFHDERTPSFNVNADKGFYYCFGCQQKGDVFSFIMEYEGKSFVEAAEGLAAQLGIVIPQTMDRASLSAHRSEKSEMLAINQLAADFFRSALRGPAGEPARRYLDGRAVSDATAERFGLGYAPAEWRALCDALARKRVSLRLAEKLGLIVPQPKAGGHYDRFRDRLICPVVSTGGEIVGFSGRRLASGDASAEAGAKYINSPESAVYKKSRLLFGANLARDGMRRAGHALVVEGNFDVISLHQAGFDQTVAPLGTALTDEQAGLVRRLVGRAVLLYDGDAAGRAATIKALKTLLEAGVDVHIATMPAGEDPDSLLQRGQEQLTELLERTQPAVEYFIHEVWAAADRSAHGRAAAVAEAAAVLGSITDPTRRDFAVGTFAKALDVPEDTLRRGLRRAHAQNRADARRSPSERAGGPPAGDAGPAPVQPSGKPDPLELDILAILNEYPELLATARERDVVSLLTDSRLRVMYTAAERGESVLSAASDPNIVEYLLAGAYASIKDPVHCFNEAVDQLRRARVQRDLNDLQRRAEDAKRRGDVELGRKLFREILQIRKQVD